MPKCRPSSVKVSQICWLLGDEDEGDEGEKLCIDVSGRMRSEALQMLGPPLETDNMNGGSFRFFPERL